jgi:transcription elongation factor GreA
MGDDRIPMTRDGYEKKKAELDRLQGPDMAEIGRRVAAARELGDLSENAEYHAAREDQGMLQAKINLLKDQLARALIVEPETLNTDTVQFGSRVTVMDLDIDEEETYELVGPGQENPETNRILTSSPIAQGLLGKKKGAKVEIPVPRGTIRFKILKIELADLL